MPTINSKGFPSSEAVIKARQIAAGSLEAAEYFASQLTRLANNSTFLSKHLNMKASVLEAMKEFVHETRLKFSPKAQPWLGQTAQTANVSSNYSNLAEIASQISSEIKQASNQSIEPSVTPTEETQRKS